MQGNGIVTAVDDESVEVSIEPQGGCSKCGLCLIEKNSVKRITLPRTIQGISEGEEVTISVSGTHALLVSFLTYIVPLICMVGGYGIGGYVSRLLSVNNEGIPILTSFVFLGTSLGSLRYVDRYFVKKCLPLVSLEKKT